MKKWLLLPVLASAFVVTGCEGGQYDKRVGSCRISNGQAEVGVWEYVDSDETSRRVTSDEVKEMCRTLKAPARDPR